MRVVLIILSSAVTVVAALPYLRETVNGQTKPRIASWFVWGSITIVGVAASFTQHQIPAGIYALFCALECFAIVAFGFRYGDRHLERLDILCLVGASAGLLCLVLVKAPVLALLIALLTDFLGAIPTIKHAWLHPQEETPSTYVLNAIGSGITLLVANFHVFTAIGYPLYLFLLDGSLAGILLAGRRAQTRMQGNGADSEAHPAHSSTPPLPVPVIYYPKTPSAIAPTPISSPPAKLTSASPTRVPALSWAANAGADTYNVYRNGTKVAMTKLPTFVDTTALQGIHAYYVTTTNAAAESPPSKPVSVTVDQTPPAIAYQVDAQPNAQGWYSRPVKVVFTARDEKVGIASCSSPVIVDRDGARQIVTGYAMNYAGDSSSISVVVSLDQTPPALGPTSWSVNPVDRGGQTTLIVPVLDCMSGVQKGEHIGHIDPGPGEGTAMRLANNQLTATFDAAVPTGEYRISVRAVDVAGNWSALVSTVLIVK